MATSKHSVNHQPVTKRCVECEGEFITPFTTREKCLTCAPTTKTELNRLLHFEGAHVVRVFLDGSTVLIS